MISGYGQGVPIGRVIARGRGVVAADKHVHPRRQGVRRKRHAQGIPLLRVARVGIRFIGLPWLAHDELRERPGVIGLPVNLDRYRYLARRSGDAHEELLASVGQFQARAAAVRDGSFSHRAGELDRPPTSFPVSDGAGQAVEVVCGSVAVIGATGDLLPMG